MSNQKLPEITIKAVLLGSLLSMLLAGANAYLGLFAGMTVSASIPAAVISMGVLSLFRKSNILENNIVQTAASAGESLAAGVIFTIPALVLLGYWETFDYVEIAKIAAIGGVIGVLFTVPLRRALIVNAKLKYPEGIATAEVLRAGDDVKKGAQDDGSGGIKTIGLTGLAGGIMKLFQGGLGAWHSEVAGAFSMGKSIFGAGAIPIYSAMVGFEGDALDSAWDIWNSKIRYLGVGAMVIGGVWSLIKLFKPLVEGISSSLAALKNQSSDSETPIEEQDMPINYVVIGLIALLVPVFLLYLEIINSIGIAVLLTIVMMVFGFLFSAVAAYMAGVVGSSNNPISGVTIATILFTSLFLLSILGTGSGVGAASAIMVGAVVCCAAAIGGDNLQDLKSGYILGATPWKQQIMQMIGVLSSAVVLGLVLDILHTAYTIGSPTLSAPQATLMKSVADGVFTGNLPWTFVYIGGVIAVILIILDLIQEKKGSDFRVPVLAVAVGIYLPITLTVPIFIGGMVNHYGKKAGGSNASEKRGLLMSSGFITGEALMGILVAVPIFLTGQKDWWPQVSGINLLGPILFLGMIYWLYKSVSKK